MFPFKTFHLICGRGLNLLNMHSPPHHPLPSSWVPLPCLQPLPPEIFMQCSQQNHSLNPVREAPLAIFSFGDVGGKERRECKISLGPCKPLLFYLKLKLRETSISLESLWLLLFVYVSEHFGEHSSCFDEDSRFFIGKDELVLWEDIFSLHTKSDNQWISTERLYSSRNGKSEHVDTCVSRSFEHCFVLVDCLSSFARVKALESPL